MNKLVILLLAIGLFAACNNNKGGKKADYREKDDYSNSDGKDDESDDKSKKDNNEADFSSGDGWSESDKTSFLSECMTGFVNNEDIGKKVCPCALVKFAKDYSSFAEANRAPESVGNRIGKECMQELNINANQGNDNSNQGTDDNQSNNAGSGWPESEVQGFLSTCVPAAQKEGLGYLDAQSYCDCMQYKLEKAYPNVYDSRLKNLDKNSKAFLQMAKSCLPGN